MVNGFTLSSGIGTIPDIERFVGVDQLSRNPAHLLTAGKNRIYSWGSKPYSVYAAQLANITGLSHVRLEDGFVCSFGRSGRRRKYSIVVDPVGIYYDASSPSLLENILNGLDVDSWKLKDPAYVERARHLVSKIVERNITKYNHIDTAPAEIADVDRYVLVIDQTAGDQSVRLGGMDSVRFSAMLQRALADHPEEKVFVKVHPEVLAGRKQGYLAETARRLGVKLISGEIPASRWRDCAGVYVGTSLFGMEALLRGVPVVCFGLPFYAGWGATSDNQHIPRRTSTRSVAEIFIAAYMLYARYLDPVSGKPCELEDILDHIDIQTEQRRRIGETLCCVGITPWKRRYIDRYLMRSDFGHQHMAKDAFLARRKKQSSVVDKASVLVWGRKSVLTPLERALGSSHKVVRMEDGFVRSVGLGSNFTAPRSLVIDDIGIYFDATRPSRMEHLLEHHDCDSDALQRSQALIDLLLDQKVSKYTGIKAPAYDRSWYRGKAVILVIGQVEGDASLEYGGDDIKSNKELLKAVKKRNPDRCIVYKPHPDVVSGNRSDGIENYGELSTFCDRVETQLPIEVVLRLCEEIHTITSLAGLEALLYGKKVVTYGKPFYAGWGLTEDLCCLPRRTRKRSLQELVYISYIRYPAYLDIDSGEFTSVEKTISAILAEREETRNPITATGLRKYVNIVRNIRKGLTYAA